MATPKYLRIGLDPYLRLNGERGLAMFELVLITALIVVTAIIPFITIVQPKIRAADRDSSITGALNSFIADKFDVGIELSSTRRRVQRRIVAKQALTQLSSRLITMENYGTEFCSVCLRKTKVGGVWGRTPSICRRNGRRLGYDSRGDNCNRRYDLMPNKQTDKLPQRCIKLFNNPNYGNLQYNREFAVISFPIKKPGRNLNLAGEELCELYQARYEPR